MLTNYCLHVQVQSTEELTYAEGTILKYGKLIDVTHTKNLIINQAPKSDADTYTKIALLLNEQEAERVRYSREMQLFRLALQQTELLEMSLRQLADEYRNASDYRKGEIIALRQETQTKLTAAKASEPLPPIAPNWKRYDLQFDLLKRQLLHDQTISANLVILSTNLPLWKPKPINS